MRIDPALKALCSDPAAQRRAEHAMRNALATWQNLPHHQQIQVDLATYAAGQALADLPGLHQLLHSRPCAAEMAQQWMDHFLPVLQDHPFAQFPLRHSYSPGFATMNLALVGNAVLSLVCYEQKPGAQPPQGAHFADREQHEIVLAGAGQAQIYHLAQELPASARVDCQTMDLAAGSMIALPSRQYGRDITGVKGRLLMLQLQRLPDDPRPARDYRLADGAMIHQACASKSESQCEMALAVLGALGRADAVPTMLELAGQGGTQLRWEALRHALALDCAAGFDRLGRIAAAESDPLASHAAQVRQQLIHAYPQLAQSPQPAQRKDMPCPA